MQGIFYCLAIITYSVLCYCKRVSGRNLEANFLHSVKMPNRFFFYEAVSILLIHDLIVSIRLFFF